MVTGESDGRDGRQGGIQDFTDPVDVRGGDGTERQVTDLARFGADLYRLGGSVQFDLEVVDVAYEFPRRTRHDEILVASTGRATGPASGTIVTRASRPN